MTWYVYIVRCADNSLYTGVTTNLVRRVREHNMGNKGSKYVRTRRPVRVVYKKRFTTRSKASQREAAIKILSKQQKEGLISAFSP